MKQKTCRNCKNKFTPTYSTTQVVCSPLCAAKLAKDVHSKKELEFKQLKKGHSKYVGHLQDEVNRLARMIDEHYNYTNCIDCGKHMGKQIHGAHYHPVGGNSSLRYNLHNIHSAKSECNKYSPDHKQGYANGILNRYGIFYRDIILQLPLKYKHIKLMDGEHFDKLKIARKLIREFKTHVQNIDSAIQAREYFNQQLGIYNN